MRDRSRTRKARRRRDPARRVLVGVVLAVVLLVGGSIGAYAYDASTRDEIAQGVTVSGVSLGGMTADQARDRLDRVLASPLRKPVSVEVGDRTWELSGEDAKVEADVDSIVDEAIAASTEGGVFGRIARRITGGEVDRELEPTIRWADGAVEDFVAEVAGEVDRDAVDAKVEPSGSSLGRVEHRNGRKLDTEELAGRITALLGDPSADRELKARPEVVEPEVTSEKLAEAHPVYLTVDRPNFRLHIWRNLELEKTYTISIGRIGNDTPSGLYSIQNKAVDPAWHVPNSDWAGELAGQVIPPGPENPIKARWLGIYDGVGIHGTADEGSLGSAASRGCLRMAVSEVKELYEKVPVGTPIYIA